MEIAMKKFICPNCGYYDEGTAQTEKCPNCDEDCIEEEN